MTASRSVTPMPPIGSCRIPRNRRPRASFATTARTSLRARARGVARSGPNVARVVKDLRSSDVQIARDLSVLAFSDTKERLFEIASDRELHLKPPARYGRQSPALERVQVIGSTVVATWMSCAADGCVTSAVVDTNGRNVGKALDGSVGVALDDRRIALAGHDGYGDLVVLDRAAHVLGRITFQADDVGDTAIARIAPDEVAIAWTSMGPSYHAARVRIGKKLAVGPIRDFAMCPSLRPPRAASVSRGTT